MAWKPSSEILANTPKPMSFGSLVPSDNHFDAIANRAACEGAVTPLTKGGLAAAVQQASSPRFTKAEQAAFRTAACLLGKDVPRIAALCNKQATEVAAMWLGFRGTSSYKVSKQLPPEQRSELASSLISRLTRQDNDTSAEEHKVDAMTASKLHELTSLGLVGQVVDALLRTCGPHAVLATAIPLVKASNLGMADLGHGNAELAGWQQASEDDELDLYSGPRDMTDVSDDDMMDAAAAGIAMQSQQTQVSQVAAREDMMMDNAALMSPPDSNTTTGLGTADAAVSLAINGMATVDKPRIAFTNGSTGGGMKLWPADGEGTGAVAVGNGYTEAADNVHAVPVDGPGIGARFSGEHTAISESHPVLPTPSHSRRNSRPSTPQRTSPSDGGVAKICTNCGTGTTPLWRKEGGVLMCNACGIYFKTHGFHRPVDLIRAAATTSRRESGGGTGNNSRAATPTGRASTPGHRTASPMGRGRGGDTPASSELWASAAGASGLGSNPQQHLHGDTATSPPHRRRRSSPSPLRFRKSAGLAEGASSGGAPGAISGGGGMFASDGEEVLSDGPGNSGGSGVARRSARRRTPRPSSWQDSDEPGHPPARRASSGTGVNGSVLHGGGVVVGSGGSLHGKRSRFGDQFHRGGSYTGGGGAYPSSAPNTLYSGSDYGDEVDAISQLADASAMEGGATNHQGGQHGQELSAHAKQQSMRREFSFGVADIDAPGGSAHPQDTRQGPHGLACITPRLPSGPVEDSVRKAADEALAAAGGEGAWGVGQTSQPHYPPRLLDDRTMRRPSVSDVSVSEQQVSASALSHRDSMEVETTSDLTVEHDPAQVAAVLLGLKHALVIQEDSPPGPAYHQGGPGAVPAHVQHGGRSQAGSGRNSPWGNSPLRGRRGPVSSAVANADRGYWSGPDDTPSARPTKRSRSPMARILNGEGGGSGSGPGSARASPAHSGGGAAASEGRPPITCANCGTGKTPLWRKDKETGESMCNACGIYKQTHGYARPFKGSSDARDASPSVSAAAGAASGPVQVPRKPRPSGSITSGGGAGGSGTPPGSGAGAVTSGAPRRASTGFLAGGRPPLPPPSSLRGPASAGGAPVPALQSHQSHPLPGSDYNGTGSKPAGTAAVPPPAAGVPWGQPLQSHASTPHSAPVMAPWPFYQLQMASMAAAHQQQQMQHQQQAVPPPERLGSALSAGGSVGTQPATGPQAGSSLQGQESVTTLEDHAGSRALVAVAPPAAEQQSLPSQLVPSRLSGRELAVTGQTEPAVGRPSFPQHASHEMQHQQQGAVGSPSRSSGAPAALQQASGSPHRGNGQQPQLSIAPLRPQLPSQASGSNNAPALGMPADPNQALAAAAALAAALQQHQQAMAAAARNGSSESAGNNMWQNGAPHPFLASVYSAQHHMHHQQQFQQQYQQQQYQQQQQYMQQQQQQQRAGAPRPMAMGVPTQAGSAGAGNGSSVALPRGAFAGAPPTHASSRPSVMTPANK